MEGTEAVAWNIVRRRRAEEGRAVAIGLLNAATGKPAAYLDTRSDAVLRGMRMELAADGAPERVAARAMALTRGAFGDAEPLEAEEGLLRAELHFMADWLPREDWNILTLTMITAMSEVRRDGSKSAADILFGQIATGYIEVSGEVRDSSGRVLREAERKPSDLVRADGAVPSETGGMSEDEDDSLRCYREYKRACDTLGDEGIAVYGAKLRLLPLSEWANEPVFASGELVRAVRALAASCKAAS